MPELRNVTCCVLMAGFLLASCAPSDAYDSPQLRPVSVERVEHENRAYIVFMREIGGEERTLPIAVGLGQARSISIALREVALKRPNTHDLIKNVLEGVSGQIERVVITDLRDNVYYARIELRVGGRLVEVDARPSDAIAVALRTGAPVFANQMLFKSDSRRMEADNPLQDCPSDPEPQSKEQPVV